MSKKCPTEFQRDVFTVAPRGDLTVSEGAEDFGGGEEASLHWMKQAEIVQLRRDKRRLEVENEILRRAAGYFPASPLQEQRTRWSVFCRRWLLGAVGVRGARHLDPSVLSLLQDPVPPRGLEDPCLINTLIDAHTE